MLSGGVLHSLRPDASVMNFFAVNSVHHAFSAPSAVGFRALARSGDARHSVSAALRILRVAKADLSPMPM